MSVMVFAVSDSSGATAERVVQTGLVQFDDAQATIVRRGSVRNARRLRAVVREAARHDAIVVHTLVSNDLRRLMLTECRSYGLDSLDLMGPILDRLATHLKLTPREKPGLFKQLTEARSREIEAVDFAFRHDDGLNVGDLGHAEVVLVGISRTMKTPTALYLAYRGWFAANVPIVPGIALPPELLAVPPERVICLVMSPLRLRELREVRVAVRGIPGEAYASLSGIRDELRYAQNLAASQGWRQLDVTGKSVEEVAREISLMVPVGEDTPGWRG